MKSYTSKTLAVAMAVLAISFESSSIVNAKKNLRGSVSDTNAVETIQEKRNLIIEGEEVEKGDRYPYFALMAGSGICGATVIGPRLVLGAAHCADVDDKFRIGVHQYNVSAPPRNDVLYANIKSRHIHPLYVEVEGAPIHDVVLFELEDYVHLTDYIRLDNYHSGTQESIDSVYKNSEFNVIGFGDTIPDSDDEVPPTTMSEVTIPYIPNNVCSKLEEYLFEDGSSVIGPGMMCAGAKKEASCHGDSGGPLIKMGDTWKDDVLAGVVSFAAGCGVVGTPHVYASVAYYYDWIVETICTKLPIGVGPDYIDCSEYNYVGSSGNAASMTGNVPQQPQTIPSPSTNNHYYWN